MKILWLDLNSSYAHSSLALPALHAQMATNDSFEWEIVSATINENVGMVTNSIYHHHPDIIAATNWLFNHEQLLHILSRAKALLPYCRIALGGPEFLGDNEDFLRKNPFVDCVFRGEGEEVFPQWLQYQNQPEQWDTVTGLCYLDKKNLYHDNGIARVMNFVHLIPPEKSSFFNWSKPFVQLETTRGCFNTCAFCVSGGEKPVRTLPIETIREKELAGLPKGLLHLEAGIQSLREPVLEQSRRMGRLSDALDGLKYLCSLHNMETHADLIAGLPLYHLSEIFEDIHTLAEYGAGEIQLESLKLLPGTEMRRRAEELGIQYAPLPPYEVLQTREISVDELQTARVLSRLLDGFYNTPTWQNITRTLMLENEHFLHHFLDHLMQIGLIDQPLSLEKRGLILYEFCKQNYPAYQTQVSIAWIEAGMSLKKLPAEKVKTKRQIPPETWITIYGKYKETLRLCFLPANQEGQAGYWFGFESEIQKAEPVFKALTM